jgi:N-acetylmuramic acid 6-phosphate etherase
MPVPAAIRLMLSEESRIARRLLVHTPQIERVVHFVARTIKRGGRLIYVGAGTSGRLGVLDASECPPTFGTNPDQVQAIIAGGPRALTGPVEGAEDDATAGAREVRRRRVCSHDVVVGIAASGRTPFVRAALRQARLAGATTVLLCFNPRLKLSLAERPDVVIAANVGPEILTGSTRLKAGTATKLLLNIFSTLAMVRLGKVTGNLMTDLKPANAKLRERAIRIVMELADCSRENARSRLEASRWNVRDAIARPASKPPTRARKISPANTRR